jgi:hypothetical protein
MMLTTNSFYLLFLGTFFFIFSFIISSAINVYALEFDSISPINLIKEDGTVYKISPTFIVEEGYKVFNNTDVQNDRVIINKGESVKISYESPCGFADSIKGLLLKGKIDQSVSTFSANTSPLQTIKLSGDQIEFYDNSSPQEKSIEIANIPENISTDVEIADIFPDRPNEANYKIVLVLNCDEEIVYYTADAEVVE